MFLSQFVQKRSQLEILEFEPNAHEYRINSKYLQSITRLLGDSDARFIPDDVIRKCYRAWQKNAGSKYHGKSRDEIKQMWIDARDLGTLMHAGIESFFKTNLEFYVSSSPESIQFRNFCREHADLLFPIVGIEQRIVDQYYRLAGTVDLITADEINESLILIDWKRTPKVLQPPDNSKTVDISANYWYQLNLYREIIEKNYAVKVSQMYIVQLHPELDNYRLVHVGRIECGHLLQKRKKELARLRWKSAIVAIIFIQEIEDISITAEMEKQMASWDAESLRLRGPLVRIRFRSVLLAAAGVIVIGLVRRWIKFKRVQI